MISKIRLACAAALCISVLALGCSTPPTKSGSGDCEGSAPGCGTCEAPVCTDGAWSCVGTPCANNQSNNNQSNNDNNTSCQGDAPGCGECSAPVCANGSWSCQGTPCAQPQCETVPEPDCGCEEVRADCLGDEWICPDAACPEPFECSPQSESNLDGVFVEFPATTCSWTVEEAAAGIEIPYLMVVDQQHVVVPLFQQNGCDDPGPSRLAPLERLLGMEQSYCICDVGLCQDNNDAVDVVPGSYEHVFTWDGVNWNGPSDTGNPKGEPFPPGIYTLEVSALGVTETGEPYEVLGVMDIRLTE